MNASRRLPERVVVTGLGEVSCLGSGEDEFWKRLLAGESGVSEVTTIQVDKTRCYRVGEVKDFNAAKITSRPEADALGRASQFAVAAAQLALNDAAMLRDGHLSREADPDQIGVIMGTTTGDQQIVEEVIEGRLRGREQMNDIDMMRRFGCGAIAVNIAEMFGFHGYSVVLPAACSGGNYAIAHAYDLIRTGRLSIALVGGADCLSKHFIYGFSRLGALAPERCQPFDRNRKGIIPGEGAGVLVLESLTSAIQRSVRVYSEILGYGISSDAYHVVAPHSEGRGAVQAMRDALAYSNLKPQAVQYISAHGTGTAFNDLIETHAIKQVFGDYSYQLPISSVKSMLGHPASAASALEAIVCNLVIRDGMIPPTINYEEEDPACDLDYVPNEARRAQVNVAMNNSYAFLGSNASVIFSRIQS